MEGILRGKDLYYTLNLPVHATEAEITIAFRKQAILCHPDVFPDNKIKAQTFQAKCQAYAILTDRDARMSYDRVLRSKAVNSIMYGVGMYEVRKIRTVQDEKKYLLQRRADELRMEYYVGKILLHGSPKLDREMEKFKEFLNSIDINLIREEKREYKEVDPERIKINWHVQPKYSDVTDYKRSNDPDFETHGQIKSVVVLPFHKGAVVEFVTKKSEIEKEKEEKRAIAERFPALKWFGGRPVAYEVDDVNDLPKTVTKEQQLEDRRAIQVILDSATKKHREDELMELFVAKFRAKRQLS